MATCPHCSKDLPSENYSFCPECGKPLTDQAAAAAEPVEAVYEVPTENETFAQQDAYKVAEKYADPSDQPQQTVAEQPQQQAAVANPGQQGYYDPNAQYQQAYFDPNAQAQQQYYSPNAQYQQYDPSAYGAPAQSYYAGPMVPPTAKSKVVAGVLGILLGAFGAHKFYLGYTKEAVIMLLVTLLTFGLGAIAMEIIGLIEGILYLVKEDYDFYQTYVLGHKGWF
jgi:TM2 domain-containing membrane protein YozV